MNERSIFLAALEVPNPAERAAYLDKACAGDPAVRRGVEDLLAAHARSGSFMPAPAVNQMTSDHTPSEGPGSRVGPYKLLQQIGEGGMGVIYMAEQEQPVRRMVALKIIREGMDSKAVLARFEAERQALALMDYPNIARVLDAGETPPAYAGGSPRPFFVMELVKGVPITKFCDENQLTLRERLELFVPVCQAIQHAHQKGVIHRDIKPSNVLVALYDDKPVPKVIDFGVAKATSQKLTDKTLFTAFGAVVGTLEYMSPEQAKLNQLDIDTRSDVYALGVLLYELLTGSTPLDRARVKAAALDEVLRLIREEEPERPSTRLSTTHTRPAIAAARRAEPAQLGKVLRGELDWIVMKALEKDRTRRYETANGLARDVERYLKDEAVEACPPTLGYRLRKLYRKNRPAAGVVAAFLVLLAGAAVVATVLAVQAKRAERAAIAERAEANEQRQQAERERQRAEEEKMSAQAVRDFLQNDLLGQASRLGQARAGQPTGGDFEVKLNPTVEELLDRAAARLTPDRIEAKFPNMPFVQAEVLKTIGHAYIQLNQVPKAFDLLTRAVALYGTARGLDDPAALDARHRLAMAHFYLDRYDEARKQLEAVRDDMIRVLPPHAWDTFLVQIHLGYVYERMNQPTDAIAYYKRLRDQVRADDGPDNWRKIAWATGSLGTALLQAKRGEEALRELEANRVIFQQRKLRLDNPDTQRGLHDLSNAYQATNRHKEAIALLEELQATWEKSGGDPRGPTTCFFRHELASCHFRAGDRETAAKLFETNLALAPTSDRPREIMTLEGLYEVNMARDRVEDALAQIRKALDLRLKYFGPDYRGWRTGKDRALIGIALLRQQKYVEAETHLLDGYQEMVENDRHPYVWDDDFLATVSQAILDLYKAMNKPDELKKWQAERAKYDPPPSR